MCRKTLFLFSFVLMLVLAGSSQAVTFVWDNGGASNLWNVPENWDPDGVPTSSDEARINIPDANCIIDSSVEAVCSTVYVDGNSVLNMTGGTLTMDGYLQIGQARDSNSFMIMTGGVASMGTENQTNGRLWVGINGTGNLIMKGGEMNIYDKTEIGRNAGGGVGNLYMEGGTINFNGNSADLEIGKTGIGNIYMTGGVLNVQDYIKCGQETGGSGNIYLDGGTIYCNNLRGVNDTLGTALIDITEGALVLNTDRRSVINDYISKGWLVGYGGIGLLNVVYTSDPNQTTVTASNLPPELASIPTPRNRSTVSRPVTLEWTPGMYAVSHDVYFGTDPNAINDANNVSGVWPEFKGNQDSNSFDPGELELGKTYYWRIDEVNEADPNSPWKGAVWEFTITDYIVIDDFESYNEIPETEPGSKLVYSTWTDGYANPTTNGATIGYVVGNSLEYDNVHGGHQAVQVAYNDTTATYSEVTVNIADLGITTNWTQDNISTLSLWFYGGPNNSTTERMYVKLNGAKVVFNGSLTDIGWQEWSIPLSDFGIDLSNVTQLAIGFEKTGVLGGTGSILLDDIRLYAAAE
jgi:hypothetical protein